MKTHTSYNSIVTKAVLTSIDFDIKEMNGLESIIYLLFKREEYQQIVSSIQQKEWDKIRAMNTHHKVDFREYMDIMKFTDQNGKHYVITVYDNDELWQEPEILDLFTIE